MKLRPRKIDYSTFKKMWVNQSLSYKELAKFFNVTQNSIISYRVRHFQARGWANGKHPMQGRHHSPETIKILKNKPGLKKEKNPNWQGGRFINNAGYYMVRVDNHPFAYRNYVLEHRLIIEASIGRYLTKKEIIHHINGIKIDNRIENLIILNRSMHSSIHTPKGSKIGKNSTIR